MKTSFIFSDFIYRNVDLLLTQSEFMKDHLKNRLPKNKVKFLPKIWLKKDFEKLTIPEIRKKLKKIYFTGNLGNAQDLEKNNPECFKILKK